MKFLCLAYGSEADWKALSAQEQAELLAQDEKIRKQGHFMAAVQTAVTTVTNWDGKLVTKNASYPELTVPLAGFSIIEAENVDEVVKLVSNSPCARAHGAVEIRPFLDLGGQPATAQ